MTRSFADRLAEFDRQRAAARARAAQPMESREPAFRPRAVATGVQQNGPMRYRFNITYQCASVTGSGFTTAAEAIAARAAVLRVLKARRGTNGAANGK